MSTKCVGCGGSGRVQTPSSWQNCEVCGGTGIRQPRIETLLDWRPETKSLLERLTKAGFKLVRGNNGGDEDFQCGSNLDLFLDELIAADDARLFVFDPALNRERWLYLVFGNSPGELVCDYSVPRKESDPDNLTPVCDAHYSEWELKGQPKKRGYYNEAGKWIDVAETVKTLPVS